MILIDGIATNVIPALDSTVLRGDGCFEAIRSYGGRLFALDEHLDRLDLSARALEIDAPGHELLSDWCRAIASDLGDGIVRVVLSRGDAVPGSKQTPRCVVLGHALPEAPAGFRMATVRAPWHAAGREWELAGAKTVSYAPNLSATRVAQSRGAHDALLISDDRTVLEGPTFSVGWVMDGRLETPGLDLLILDSITRRHALRLARAAGLEVVEGTFDIARLEEATEVMVWSTVKEVTAVMALDDRELERGPMTDQLASLLRSHVEASIGVR